VFRNKVYWTCFWYEEVEEMELKHITKEVQLKQLAEEVELNI
jgi:hypothetical protein